MTRAVNDVEILAIFPVAYVHTEGFHIEILGQVETLESDNRLSFWFLIKDMTVFEPTHEAAINAAAVEWFKAHGLRSACGRPRLIRLH